MTSLPKSAVKIHYSRQKEYFKTDLAIYTDYTQNLNAWRKSYIGRIKHGLLKRNYKGKTLIDLGTGSGYVAVEMAKLGMKVYACDLSPTSINNLEKYKKQLKLTNLHILFGYAENIPLPNNSIDYIVANAILEHIPNEQAAITEWSRILKSQGKIFITVPLRFRYMWPFFWPIHYIHDKLIGHLRRYDLEALKEKFRPWMVKEVYYTGHFPKMCWLLISRLFVMGIQKNLRLDDYIEKLDARKRSDRYGASNITIVFEKK